MLPFASAFLQQPVSGVAPPTIDTYWDQVVLMMGFAGTNGSTTFSDESQSAHSMTANGNVAISTAQSVFGGSSGVFDGSGDYVSSADSADWDFGSGDFTVECFVRFNSVTDATFFTQWSGASGTSGYRLYRNSSAMQGNADNFTCSEAANAWSASTGVWYHIVGERAGSVVRIYRDGVMKVKTTGVAGSIPNSTVALQIGAALGDFNGWMDELRVTKGVARYNSDSGYTVPTAAFPRLGPPSFSVNPLISGVFSTGQTLTLSPGTDTGTSRSYQWKRDGVAIGGETATTYVVVSGDAGHTITCTVTATNANGSTSATSNGLPAIRGSSLFYVNNAINGALPLPTGSAAGDLMVIYAGHGYGVTTPSGWTARSSISGSNYNGAVFTKILSSGDISTGSVTIAFGGIYYGTIIGVTFVGATAGYRDIGATRNGGGASSRTVTTGSSVLAGDYLILFGSARVNAAATSSSLVSALQSNTAFESSAVARFGFAAAGGAQSGTINYAGSPSGDYQAIVAIAP